MIFFLNVSPVILEIAWSFKTFYNFDSIYICCQLIQRGKGEAIRIRAILRSLIPIEDLEGVISISFKVPSVCKGKITWSWTLTVIQYFCSYRPVIVHTPDQLVAMLPSYLKH